MPWTAVFHHHLAEVWLLEFFTLGTPLFLCWIKSFCELKKKKWKADFSVFWKPFHRGLPLVGMLWFQRWFEKLLTHVAASFSSGSFHQLVQCRALRGSGMDKITEINWGEKTNKLNKCNFCFQSKCLFLPWEEPLLHILGQEVTSDHWTVGFLLYIHQFLVEKILKLKFTVTVTASLRFWMPPLTNPAVRHKEVQSTSSCT